MIKYPYFPLLVILVLSVSCSENQHKPDTEAADYDSTVGWFHGKCLAIKNPTISRGTKIKLIQLADSGTVYYATVLNKTTNSDVCFPLLEDRRQVNIESGYSFYSIDSDKTVNLGIGLIGTLKNSQEYTFNYCNTTEGILFSLENKNLNNKNIWNGYYYLGYESEANCKD